jgi:hypothetical protein
MDVTSSTPQARPDDRHRNVQVMKNNELRETMWELCYDLLPAAERAALIARIKSDPQAARLYAEVRLQADLVATAAVVEDDALVVAPPADLPGDELHSSAEHYTAASVGSSSVGSPKQVSLTPVPRPRKRDAESVPAKRASRSSRQSLHWLLATAALVLVGVMGYGLVRPLQSQHALADRYVVTEIETPALMQSGLSNKVVLKSRSVRGESIEAHVDLKVVDSAGKILFHEGVPTNAEGEASVEIPGKVLVPGVRLEAAGRNYRLAQAALDSDSSAAESASPINSITVDLPVQAEPPLTYFWFDRPLGSEDEPVQYAAVSLDRFSLRPVAAEPRSSVAESSLGSLSRAHSPVADDTREPDTRGLARSETPLDAYLVEGTFDRKSQGDKLQGDKSQAEASDTRLDSLAIREQLERRGAAADNMARSLEFRRLEAQNAPPGYPAGGVAGGASGQAKAGEAGSGAEGTQLALGGKETAKKRADPLENSVPLRDNEPLAEVASARPPAPAGPAPSSRGGGFGGGAPQVADSVAGGFFEAPLPANAAPGSSTSASGIGASEMEAAAMAGATMAGATMAGAVPAPATDTATDTQSLALRSLPILPAGEPVTVELSDRLRGRKLLIQAINRDVVVATRTLPESTAKSDRSSAAATDLRRAESAESRPEATGVRQFTLSLPPEADGQVEVEVLDLEQTPPQVIQSYAYYRRPSRELQIDFVSPRETQTRFAPGETVEMRLRVQNEQGEASPAALGVRVWSETAIQETGEPVLLAEHVRRSQSVRFSRPDLSDRLAQLEAKDSSRDMAQEPARSKQFLQEPAAMTFSADAENQLSGALPAPGSPPPGLDPAGLPAPAAAPREVVDPLGVPAEPAPPPAPPEADNIAAAASPDPAAQPASPADRSGTASAVDGLAPAAGAIVEAEMATLDDGEQAANIGDVLLGSSAAWDPTARVHPAEPLRLSNKLAVSSEFQSQQSALEAQWRAWRAIVGRILVIAGVVLMLGLAVQLWIRMPTRVLGVTLAMTAAAASLVVGAIWVGRSPAGYEVAYGLATDSRPPETSAPRAMVAVDAAPADAAAPEFSKNENGYAAPFATGDASIPAADRAANEPLAAVPGSGAEAAAGRSAEPSFGRDASPPGQAADGVSRDRPVATNSPEEEALATRLAPEGLMKSESEDRQKMAAEPKSSGERLGRLSGDQAFPQSAPPGGRGGAAGAAPPSGGAAVRLRSAVPPPVQPATAPPERPAETAPLVSTPGEAVPPAPPAPAPAPAPATALADETDAPASADKLAESEWKKASAPASLYFNPRLATDEDGFVTITFQMPAVESDYRVLVDALGDGRIGSRELRIQCRLDSPPAAAAEK